MISLKILPLRRRLHHHHHHHNYLYIVVATDETLCPRAKYKRTVPSVDTSLILHAYIGIARILNKIGDEMRARIFI